MILRVVGSFELTERGLQIKGIDSFNIVSLYSYDSPFLRILNFLSDYNYPFTFLMILRDWYTAGL